MNRERLFSGKIRKKKILGGMPIIWTIRNSNSFLQLRTTLIVYYYQTRKVTCLVVDSLIFTDTQS